jgi:predicted dithiol-disulfide oxidoreductase (DUF899 family)
MTEPRVVTKAEWDAAQAELLRTEKAHTRASDALAAQRRRMPMTEVSGDHVLRGPDGERRLRDAFDGRRQLILYSFMFPPGGEPCGGCSMFADQVGHLAHLHARDTTFAMVSKASVEELEAHRRRMGWPHPWYSLAGDLGLYEELGVGDGFALNVLLRHGGRVLRSYRTSGRGVEALGSVWSLLDRTPMGRQETWEDAPDWVQQGDPYVWWDLHDQYAHAPAGASA